MTEINAVSKITLKIKNIELIIFTSIFVALAVGLPWLTHQFGFAGQILLPMHFFILIAGLIFGWKTGLFVGLLTPLISFSTSGMPIIAVLPQITIEVMLYGFMAGLLREKLNLNIYWSLILAMLIGRLGLFCAIVVLGTSYLGPLTSVLITIKTGWLGILLQIALVPIITIWMQKWFMKINGSQFSN